MYFPKINIMMTTPGWVLLLFSFTTRIPENTGKLQVHTQISQPFIFGSSADLYCRYNYSSANALFATSPLARHNKIYSLKWYKDGQEFYRYVPSEDEPIVIYEKPGVSIDVRRSNATRIHLKKIDWFTKGNYRCEVTAEDFETADENISTDVVAVPKRNPYITGQKSRYSVGEVVDLNCTSNASIPEAELSWYVNSVEAKQDIIHGPYNVREPSNLLTTTLRLRFSIQRRHVLEGSTSIKVKCTAMLQNVYLKSNEISFEVKPLQNIPALEIREKNGKTNLKGHNFDEFMSNKKFGRDERLSHGQTSSDSNKNIYHGSSNTWERRNGRGDDDERNGVGDRYFLSGSDFSTKISSQHFFPLKLLFHILTLVLVTYTLT